MKKYITLLVLSLGVFILFKAPVSILQKYSPDFSLSGKIINGSAFNQKIGTIEFKFNPWYLFYGKLAFNAKVVKGDNFIELVAGINLFNEVFVENTNGEFDLKYLQSFKLTQLKNLNLASAKIEIKHLNVLIDDINVKEFAFPAVLDASLSLYKVNILGDKIGDYNIVATIKESKKFAVITNSKNSSFDLTAKIEIVDKSAKITGRIIGLSENSKNLLTNFNINDKLNYKFDL